MSVFDITRFFWLGYRFLPNGQYQKNNDGLYKALSIEDMGQIMGIEFRLNFTFTFATTTDLPAEKTSLDSTSMPAAIRLIDVSVYCLALSQIAVTLWDISNTAYCQTSYHSCYLQ